MIAAIIILAVIAAVCSALAHLARPLGNGGFNDFSDERIAAVFLRTATWLWATVLVLMSVELLV